MVDQRVATLSTRMFILDGVRNKNHSLPVEQVAILAAFEIALKTMLRKLLDSNQGHIDLCIHITALTKGSAALKLTLESEAGVAKVRRVERCLGALLKRVETGEKEVSKKYLDVLRPIANLKKKALKGVEKLEYSEENSKLFYTFNHTRLENVIEASSKFVKSVVQSSKLELLIATIEKFDFANTKATFCVRKEKAKIKISIRDEWALRFLNKHISLPLVGVHRVFLWGVLNQNGKELKPIALALEIGSNWMSSPDVKKSVCELKKYILEEEGANIDTDGKRKIDQIFSNAEKLFDLKDALLPPASISMVDGELLAYWSFGKWGVDCEIQSDALVISADFLEPPLSVNNSRQLRLSISENWEKTREDIWTFLTGLPKDKNEQQNIGLH